MTEQALQPLLEGNRRYVANQSALDVSPRRRHEVAQAQKPFAAIFGCVDSRVPPELIFDQGLGELFVIRTAGEVLGKAVLGCLQFGVAELHVPMLVVLGHERCGAVKAAMEILERRGVAEADIAYLAKALAPAVQQGKRAGKDQWEQAGRAQVELLVEQLKHAPILAAAVKEGRLKVMGAWYHLETGLVEITVE